MKSATRRETCVDCAVRLPFHSINNGTTRCKPCVVSRAAERERRNKDIVQLRLQGKSMGKIAVLIGISQTMVRFALQTARVSGYGRRHEKRIPDGPRCRCGLRLPCHSCIPSIYAFAAQRRGEAASG